MKNKLICLMIGIIAVPASSAFAGDGATLILKSGASVFLDNGYKQLVDGMQSLKKSGAENYPMEVNIENTTVYVNLGEVAVLCRDKCSSLEIKRPPRQDGQR